MAAKTNDCTVLCIGHGRKLPITKYLLMAILLWKIVITDEWIQDSVNNDGLLDLANYRAFKPAIERKWRTSLNDALARDQRNLRPFRNWSIHFTSNTHAFLGDKFADWEDICQRGGARTVELTLLSDGPSNCSDTLILASKDDPSVESLRSAGWEVYDKTIVAWSMNRGSLIREEFLLTGS